MNQNGYSVIIKKTKVVEVNDGVHALPPDAGTFQEFKVADYYCPDEWLKDGVFIAVKENEPMWFDFQRNPDCACIPSIQRVNPITGQPSNLEEGLKKDPVQNYMALPIQRWLDGYAKEGKVYQFRVTASGEALAVNEYVLPKHMQDSHSMGFAFFGLKNPKPARESFTSGIAGTSFFSPVHTPNHWELGNINPVYSAMVDNAKKRYASGSLRSATLNNVSTTYSNSVMPSSAFDGAVCDSLDSDSEPKCIASSEIDMPEGTSVCCFNESAPVQSTDFAKASMGMGGRIDQKIITDDNTVDYYVEKPSATLVIYMALPEMFKAIMERGKRQDASKKDRHIMSGDIAGIPVPLIK